MPGAIGAAGHSLPLRPGFSPHAVTAWWWRLVSFALHAFPFALDFDSLTPLVLDFLFLGAGGVALVLPVFNGLAVCGP